MLKIFGEGYEFYLPEKRMQSLILFTIFLLQYLAEHLQPAAKEHNRLSNEGKNVLVGIFNLIILFVPSVLLVELLWWLKENKWGLFNIINFPTWLNFGLTVIVMDLLMYGWHRANHRVKVLWQFHKFHHLDPAMNTTTALRFHLVELLFSTLLRALVFVLMGFSYTAILVFELLFFAVVIFHHSNIRISKKADFMYRKIFSSPLMHRIHHSNKQQETDSNYSSVFSIWDHLFGSYKATAAGPITFGVDENK